MLTPEEKASLFAEVAQVFDTNTVERETRIADAYKMHEALTESGNQHLSSIALSHEPVLLECVECEEDCNCDGDDKDYFVYCDQCGWHGLSEVSQEEPSQPDDLIVIEVRMTPYPCPTIEALTALKKQLGTKRSKNDPFGGAL